MVWSKVRLRQNCGSGPGLVLELGPGETLVLFPQDRLKDPEQVSAKNVPSTVVLKI